MHPYYIARAVGGLLFLIGACIGARNIWLTITRPSPAAETTGDLPVPGAGAAAAPQPAE
jgi:cytochrome c oxidase cbb3-type subunit I